MREKTEIIVAKTAGFCFGVNRAVNMVTQLLDEGKCVCTLGPIIHNPQLVSELEARGARIIDQVEQAPPGSTVVIRSHGVPAKVYDQIRARGLQCADATCPYVAKIHRIVAEQSRAGAVILIAGDENHPEVEGIRGFCEGACFVFKDEIELKNLSSSVKNIAKSGVIVLSQTTFSIGEWKKCVEYAKKVYTRARIFDTICSATSERQSEAEKLAAESELMVVIGGRHSSNTAKLGNLCSGHCDTVLVETAQELEAARLYGKSVIGVTAGASTPARIIKEVLFAMSEILNNEPEKLENVPEVEKVEEVVEKSFDEMTFEEAFEASFKNYNTGEKVHGIVVGIAPNEVQVDVGRKQAGYIPADELSNDPNAKPEDLVKVGDEFDLLIMRTNDVEGTIMLSKRRLDAIKGWDNIVKASEDGSIVEGIVTEVIKGGVLVVSEGVRVFIPASQATLSRGEPLENLLRKQVSFRIIEVNKGRRRAVGSIRTVARELRKEQEKQFWETAAVGNVYNGTVKSLTSYGAFVDIGGVDGMVHVSELSWNRVRHPSDVVKVGDQLEVFIKEINPETKRISLGYRKDEDNPWEILKKDYPVGTDCDVTIVGITTFGAFARILPGIDGLIHISQISDRRVEKPQDVLAVGQTVRARITDIDFEKKRISLSIRVLIEEGLVPSQFADESAAEAEVEAPVEE